MNPGKVSEVTYKRAILKEFKIPKTKGVKTGSKILQTYN